MYCVVAAFKDPVRHEGHAHDGEQRRRISRWTCRPFDADGRRAAAREGRDHLREVRRARVQRRPGRSRWRRLRARTNMVAGGQTMGAWAGQPCNPVRHRTRAARIERRLGGGGRRQPGDDRHLRAVRRLVPGPGVAQRHRDAADDEGHHARQRRHRQSVVQRPRGHPRRARSPTRAKVLDAMQGSGRPATTTPRRSVHRDARRRLVSDQPYAQLRRSPTRRSRSSQAAEGHAHRHPARAHGEDARRTTRPSPTRSTARSRRCCAIRLGAELVETITPDYPGRSRRAEHRATASPTRCPSCCRG